MTVLNALILGIIQGLAEFLPISSSGHLLVAEKLMGITADSGTLLTLSIMLHFGTLAAVVIVYWKRIWNMICHPLTSELKWLILATVPAVIAALLIDFDAAFEGKFIVWSFYLTSVVLIAGDLINRRRIRDKSTHKKVGLGDALSMGVMQAVAILPGLSRSGSTISGGVASGLSRKRAADFSFLMSIPAILGSAVFDLKDAVLDGAGIGIGLLPSVVGIVAALVFGLIAIKGFLALIRRVNMKYFAIYTFLMGSFLLVNNYFFHWIAF